MAYTEGQRLQGSDGKVYVIHGGVPVLESTAPTGPMVLGTPDPLRLRREQRADNQDTRATAAAERQVANEQRRLQIEQQRLDQEGGTPIDPATRTYYAQQVLAGAPMPSLGMGKQAAAARQQIMAEVARLGGASGLTGADQAAQIAHYKAGSGQIANLEKMAGTIGVNEQTALANGQQYIDRSVELPGQTSIAPLNAISNWIQRKFGGTTISAADAAYNTFTNEYAKVVAGSPTGAGTLSDSARHEAMSTIQGNGSLAQKQAAFEQMKADMANRMVAIHGGINQAYQALTKQPGYQVPDNTNALAVGVAPHGGDHSGGPPHPFDPSSGPGSPNGSFGMATGPTVRAPVPQANAIVDAGIRAGMPVSQVNAELARQGFATVQPDNYGAYAAAIQHHKLHPGFTGSYSNATREQANPAKLTAPLAAVVTAGNAFSGGIVNRLSGGAVDAVSTASPTASAIGNIVGSTLGAGAAEAGVATGLGRLGLTGARALSWAPRIGDAAYGAVNGATGNPENPLQGALLGGSLATVGGIAGNKLLAPVAGAAFRSTPVQTTVNAGRRMFGAGPLSAVNTPSLAEREISSALTKADPTFVNAQLKNASALNAPFTVADAHPELRELAAASVRRSPAASQVAETALLPRARGQIDRFGAAVQQHLGPTANVPQLSADLTQQARTAAGPLYDAAYSRPGASSVKLDDLMNRPSMQAGVQRAYSIAREEGRDPTSLGFDLNPQGEAQLTRVPSFQTLDYVKRGLDDTLEPHRNPITGKLDLNESTRAINATKNELLRRTDAVNPDYASARATYAGPAQARDALARGQDAYRLDPDLLQMQVSGQSPDQLGHMQLGYRDALTGAAEAVRYSSNPFDATLGTPAAEQRLSVLYPQNPGVNRLLQTRDLERRMAETTNAVLGNSRTAQRQLADQAFSGPDMLGSAIETGVNLATGGGAGTLAKAAAMKAGGMFASKARIARDIGKADEIAPILLNPDPTAAAASLQDIMDKAALYRAYATATTPRRSLGMFGAGMGGALVR